MTCDVIIFHADCPDGFCAAFLAHKQWPQALLLPATHGQPEPHAEVMDKNLLVVDFSWKRPAMERMAMSAKSIIVLDHHKTAEVELAGLDYCTFDMNRSGAQMMWDYINPNEAKMQREMQLRSFRPWYVDYVADRDLWQWKLPHSKEINAFIMALPHTIEAWKELDFIGTNHATSRGLGALLQVNHYIEKVTAQCQDGVIDGKKTKIVNAAYPNISDVLNKLCELGASIGLGWFVRGDGLMQFSLRSIGDIDVSGIAKEFGGGGHKNAAGFQITIAQGLELLDSISMDHDYIHG